MRIFVGNTIHPGTVGLSIQARPQGWVADLDSVPVLKPTEEMVAVVMRLVRDRKEGRPVDAHALSAYHGAYDTHLQDGELRPGRMKDSQGRIVPEDRTLICTCSRNEARAGRCHRVWAAWWLERAGWEVYCDWQEPTQIGLFKG